MSTGRRRGVIEGNTVRKIQPSQRPYIEQHPQRNVRHHAEKVSYVNILYTIFVVLRELFTAAGGDDQPDETYCITGDAAGRSEKRKR